MQHTTNKLNLGCGNKRVAGAINLDVTSLTNPDVIHDLNTLPWPFKNEQFEEVFAYDVVEHLDNVIHSMEEIHRICSDGAKVHITVPHFSCSNTFTDPTHCHAFGWYSFDYITGTNDLSFYTKARFRYNSRQIIFHPTVFNKIIRRLANSYPSKYEQRWAWLFPSWFLYFELEVIKNID